jgi:hypothetical protein
MDGLLVSSASFAGHHHPFIHPFPSISRNVLLLCEVWFSSFSSGEFGDDR